MVPADVMKLTLGKQWEWRGIKWQDQQSLLVGHVIVMVFWINVNPSIYKLCCGGIPNRPNGR